ncbi:MULTISPECIES: DNA repair exonuclease [unclassified Roseofilum]|uniref:metallophosphoesterase family protein n=1 Tax=unclassified Roseofilum TaxID=2620099 RepID=UPI000E8092C8|nr:MULTISPECIES: DNA repair exonuclease [unclassified Roseofilum]MBP0007567.1 DNA repair exonuclease [Roseofilum sp. Belize Diploria]MBP0033951.1 DNA repair exonuclease [Roseofilum sp. Belize BBD 4]HBQ97927.1 DNA repair exonuclease [Cyanobacteria bacterium UBA11691]
MARFLHLSDVHLGFDRYDNAERTKDFFFAFKDALEKYAIAESVDFVLIAGDLFEHRQILPATLNQAQIGLELLQKANIPVLAIEGNHDNLPYGTRTSWLRYLADSELLILLEPNAEQAYDLWTPETRQGGYIDLPCDVRVIGSRWYGASAPKAILQLADSIQHLPDPPTYQIMLFHHGLEGQISRYSGALKYDELRPLKEAGIDYLALGHIHKQYTAEGWIFNPGSTEANSIAEGQDQNPRGVYLVALGKSEIQAQLKRDYYQRPIVRLKLKVNKQQTQEEVEEAAEKKVSEEIYQTKEAIVELRIEGQLGFNRLDINVRKLRQTLHEKSQALIFLLKYEVTGTEYESPFPKSGEPPKREEIEQQVFEDLLSANTRYQPQAEPLAKGLRVLKQQVLDSEHPSVLYRFVEQLLSEE